MIEQFLEVLSGGILENHWFAPFLTLLAGILTSVTPCALSSIPLVIGYVGGTGESNTKRAFRLSLTFAGGMAVTFTALGAAAALAGRLAGNTGRWWYLLLGILMVLMALQTWGIYEFIPSTYLISKNTRRGYAGAFTAGVLGGVFSSPCATPVLVVLLGIVARSGNLTWGVFLLLLYSIGHSFLVLVAGTSVGFVKRIVTNERYGRFSVVIKIFMGGIILSIGFYMFYLGF